MAGLSRRAGVNRANNAGRKPCPKCRHAKRLHLPGIGCISTTPQSHHSCPCRQA